MQRIRRYFKWNLYQKWIFKMKCKTIKGGCKVCGGDLFTSPVGFFCKNPNCNNALTCG